MTPKNAEKYGGTKSVFFFEKLDILGWTPYYWIRTAFVHQLVAYPAVSFHLFGCRGQFFELKGTYVVGTIHPSASILQEIGTGNAQEHH